MHNLDKKILLLWFFTNSIIMGMDRNHNRPQEIRIHSITWLQFSGKSIIFFAQENNARNIMDVMEVPGKVKFWYWDRNNKDGLCITLTNDQRYYYTRQ